MANVVESQGSSENPSIFHLVRECEEQIALIESDEHSSELTAIARKDATLPLRIASDFVDFKSKRVLELASGKSCDTAFIEQRGGQCWKYDPCFMKLGISLTDQTPNPDLILAIYVLNVLPPAERKIVASLISDIINRGAMAIIGVREDKENIRKNWRSYEDGFITPKKTFQTFFDKDDRRIIELFSGLSVKRIGRGTYLIK